MGGHVHERYPQRLGVDALCHDFGNVVQYSCARRLQPNPHAVLARMFWNFLCCHSNNIRLRPIIFMGAASLRDA